MHAHVCMKMIIPSRYGLDEPSRLLPPSSSQNACDQPRRSKPDLTFSKTT